MIRKPKLIILAGPTAVGKTASAIELAKALRGEILGADSMQIYRYMDIGTAKPTHQERAQAPHHLIDIRDPDQPFDAFQYVQEARKVIDYVVRRRKIPLVVGGTGLYIKALLGGIFEMAAVDEGIREQLRRMTESEGTDALYARLKACDPKTAARLQPNDTYRVLRALETFEATGVPITEHQRAHGFQDAPYHVFKIGLSIERDALYDRINRRVDAMVAEGFPREVQTLLDMGYSEELKSMQSIGYRHMVDFIRGRTSRDAATALMKRDTRRYAKRQMTWFKADSHFQWMEPSEIQNAVDMAEAFLHSADQDPSQSETRAP